MIEIPDFSRFRNGEFVKFNDMTVSVLNNHNLQALQLNEIAQEITILNEDMKLVYKADRGSTITKGIVHADILRDNMYSGIIQILRVHAKHHPDETLKKKAEKLVTVFEKHGSELTKQSYHQQTANLDDIFEDVERKGLRGDIELLGLESYYTPLLKANEDFDQLYLERNKEYAQTPEENMPVLREKAESTLNGLFDRINAFITLVGLEKYQPLMNELNALIENYESSINRRLSRGGVEEENELNQDFEEAVE